MGPSCWPCHTRVHVFLLEWSVTNYILMLIKLKVVPMKFKSTVGCWLFHSRCVLSRFQATVVLQCPQKWPTDQRQMQRALVIESWQELISLVVTGCVVVETDCCLAFEVNVNGWNKWIHVMAYFKTLSVASHTFVLKVFDPVNSHLFLKQICFKLLDSVNSHLSLKCKIVLYSFSFTKIHFNTASTNHLELPFNLNACQYHIY